MATIKLLARGTTTPTNIYLRFTAGRRFDLFAKTNILVPPHHWDNSKGTYRNLAEIEDRVSKSIRFEKLKAYILDRYNEDYSLGEVFNRDWLETNIRDFFNRPTQERAEKIKDHFIYYSDFVRWWLDNEAPKWKTGKNKYLNHRAIQQYESFNALFNRFKGRKKYKISDIDAKLITDFINWMEDEENYGSSTTKRHSTRLKFFLARAEMMGLKVNVGYKERVFVSREDEILMPYLNEEEINRVFNVNLSNDDSLDNIRDSFIISLWTGLRISDFNGSLDVSNITEDFIKIKTQKTGKWVEVPLHPQVKQVLKKRMGNLPVKFSDKHFNEEVKKVCMLANIDNQIQGKLFDKKTKRKLAGNYKKYKLISSHTGRRSFATNLQGFIPDRILADLGGWGDVKMMLHYVKRTKKESANHLKNFWDNKYENKL
ncbi:tyrosine-type recombinase/integrase [Arenibacter palladensis]|uniref:tyrosine-type recombinase/integrase n=1 Tax=Arenibacter palladensis TaxID=237373 RepID=UPI002FD4553E